MFELDVFIPVTPLFPFSREFRRAATATGFKVFCTPGRFNRVESPARAIIHVDNAIERTFSVSSRDLSRDFRLADSDTGVLTGGSSDQRRRGACRCETRSKRKR